MKRDPRLLGRILCRHRRSRIGRRVGSGLLTLYRAYENVDYNLHKNGEKFVLETISKQGKTKAIFDVGASVGTWTQMASGLFPEATVFAFEILPQSFERLQTRCAMLHNVQAHQVGLSDREGEIVVYYVPGRESNATCIDGFLDDFHGVRPRRIPARVVTGDRFCAQHGISTIDFLKLDVEGHEHSVLRGFQGLLERQKVRAVQFEYGYVNISTRFLLKDFYDFFGAFGMEVGKIYPDHVDFRDYRFQDENFWGPNYLAVRASERDLVRVLQN